MTYRELLYKATRLINNNKITLGEYDEMTKPLNREIEQEQRWIHVSERLPEIGQYVLCSLINAKDVEHRVIICEYKQEIWWSYVIAWMPLPEPYKEESEVKE